MFWYVILYGLTPARNLPWTVLALKSFDVFEMFVALKKLEAKKE